MLTERHVSRARRPAGYVPAEVSAALRRLRELSWDPLLVRSGIGMVPTPAGMQMIDPHLATLGLTRNVMARSLHFSLTPSMVASTLLVLTTGRQFCERFVDLLPVVILPCPVPFPRLTHDQLWHERTHASPAAQWLREAVKTVASGPRQDDPGLEAAPVPVSDHPGCTDAPRSRRSSSQPLKSSVA